MSSAQYLLSQYPGAAAAYSLRVLHPDFANADLVLVRRSSDNTEEGFTATEITNGTLTTWTGANDGFVVTWYDQSGNARDATQATAGSQAKIVSSGVLELNGVLFDGSNDFYNIPSLTVSQNTIFQVQYRSASGTLQPVFATTTDPGYGPYWFSNNQTFNSPGTSGGIVAPANTSTGLFLLTGYETVSTSKIRRNGTEIATGGVVAGDLTVTYLGRRQNNYHNGSIREGIIYGSDESSNVPDIEANIGTYYGITLP